MNASNWIVVLMAVVLVGCAGGGAVPSQEEMASIVTEPEYRVGPDDTLEVNVWGNTDLSVTVPVRPDGVISMPLIGDIPVGSKTPEEIAASIEVLLAEYVKSPNVTVIVTGLQSHEYLSRVRVTGAVATNLSVSHRQGMTVIDAILEAGGPTEFAAADKTKLYRDTKDGRKAFRVYLNRILKKGDISTNYELAPGDIITVPERVF